MEVLRPETVAEAIDALGKHPGARVLAGGTDIVPNLKYGMYDTQHLVALRGLSKELRYVREDGDLRLGALCTIDELASNETVRNRLPALADACSQIAGPQLRRMGTLGGNLCLDTRCVYINQSYFWRNALGFCLKKDGTVCHVVAGGQRCVAAASNDTAPVLLALGASVRIVSPRGQRDLATAHLERGERADHAGRDRHRARGGPHRLRDVGLPRREAPDRRQRSRAG